MTNNTQIKVHVDVAKLNIVFEAWLNGAPTGSVTLSAADTDSLIRELGKNRAQLVQPVASDLDEAAIEPIIDPAWQTPEVRYQEGRMLSIRDPGLGLASAIFSRIKKRRTSPHGSPKICRSSRADASR